MSVDVDECSVIGAWPCGENAVCNNTPGNVTCQCAAGYWGDGYTCQRTYTSLQPQSDCFRLHSIATGQRKTGKSQGI